MSRVVTETCFGRVIENVIKYDLYVKFAQMFAHNVHIYVLNSIVKISMMFAKYFEYYIIILRGRFFLDTLYSIVYEL